MRSERPHATVEFGDVSPAGSRHRGRRSAVAIAGDHLVAGTADSRIVAVGRESLAATWRATIAPDSDGDAAVVSLGTHEGTVLAGTRGVNGTVAAFDVATGDRLWRYETADDVGDPQTDTRFFLPFVAATAVAGDRWYVAARRYERTKSGDRRFESRIYAFEPDGAVAWSYAADASPIGVDAGDGRVAVAYNRCTGDHRDGLVVLDADDGSECWRWDPGNEGQRCVGDVALLGDGVAATSHGDYRGYRVGHGGEERWRAALATPRDAGDETLYAYPNHVHATDGGVVFVTGNTYAAESRETDSLHPEEHTAFGYDRNGNRRWRATVGGFAGGVATDGDRLAIPTAQHFRERSPDAHALHVLDVADGPADTVDAEGIVTAAAIDDDTVAAVEEPVVYHDEGVERGSYRLHRRSLD